MRHPRFRSDYRPVRLPDGDADQLLVIGETRHLLLGDPVAADLVDLIDGTRGVAEVLDRAADRHSRAAAAKALRRLSALDLLTEGPVVAHAERAAAWDARGVAPDQAQEWLHHGSVAVLDAGSPAAGAFTAALGQLGLTVHTDGDGDDPLVVLVGSMTDERLDGINRTCLDAGRSWTLVRPHGQVLLLGPHLVPGETGCWQCLRRRWLDNEQVQNFLAGPDATGPRVPAPPAVLPGAASALAGLLLTELPVLVAAGHSPRITGRMVALDTRDFTTSTHELVAAPYCPACGNPDLLGKAPARIDLAGLTAAPLTDTADGVPRTASATDTYRRVSREVSRYLGVVNRLVPVDGYDNGLMYGYRAGHQFPTTPALGTLRDNLRGYSGGQGRTETEAKVSAIAEAIERYCGVWRGERATHRASYRQLGAERAVHPHELLLFSPDQYARREQINPAVGHFHHVPRPLPDDLVLSWTTGWSLTREQPRELPAAYCWYGHPELSLGFCAADSNGSAAANTVAEAVTHGFGELVERDSVALWWYHRSRLPGVDLDSFADPWINAVRDYHARVLGRPLWALDLTADLGVPAYAAVGARTEGPGAVLVGFGAHLDARVALARAVAELNQFLPFVIGRRPGYGLAGPDAARWFATEGLAEQAWLRPDPGQPLSRVDTHAGRSSGDAAEDARRCVRIAAQAGLEVIVVDQSRPDLDLAVVKVIVPGLRHFWRRLGDGRLWRVPEALGRSPVAADEASVNPLNVFF